MEQVKRTIHRDGTARAGFTLIELLVVISLIIIVAATAMPTISNLFTAGADNQAFNMLSAQVSLARAIAIENDTYAAVHVQMADNPDIEDTCYAAILWDNPNVAGNTLSLFEGCKPRNFPGGYAFGKLDGFVDSSSGNYIQSNLSNLTGSTGFTTFTILFSPDGQVVQNIGINPTLTYQQNTPQSLFKSGSINSGETYLWRTPSNQTGVTAITMFDYTQISTLAPAQCKDYLDEYGQFLCLNVYTGRFFHRE